MRFKKVITQENGSDVISLIDSQTNEEKLKISGESILSLIKSAGEASAKSTLISIVETQYENLSQEELNEFFA